MARQPIRQDLTHPILEAKAGLARGGFRSAAGLRVKVIELREDGSSHGRACGCRISGGQRARVRCCRVGRVPWPGKRRAGIRRADDSPSAERGKKAVKTKGIAHMAVKSEPRSFLLGILNGRLFAPA